MDRAMTAAELYGLVSQPWWQTIDVGMVKYNAATQEWHERWGSIETYLATLAYEAAAMRTLCKSPLSGFEIRRALDGHLYIWTYGPKTRTATTILHALDAALKSLWEAQR